MEVQTQVPTELTFESLIYRVTQKNGYHQKSNNFQNFIQIDTKLQLH